MKSINESIICAGFGGQGIMILGKVLANAALKKDLNVTWIPSYGAEVRGGTAYAMVRISRSSIADPMVNHASTAILMTAPSLDLFERKILPGGLLIVNTSMAKEKPKRKDIDIIAAPLTDEAIKVGNMRVANMIAAGIYAKKTGIFDKDLLIDVIKEMGHGHESIVPVNIKALERGMELAG